jgi:hypothetical protein
MTPTTRMPEETNSNKPPQSPHEARSRGTPCRLLVNPSEFLNSIMSKIRSLRARGWYCRHTNTSLNKYSEHWHRISTSPATDATTAVLFLLQLTNDYLSSPKFDIQQIYYGAVWNSNPKAFRIHVIDTEPKSKHAGRYNQTQHRLHAQPLLIRPPSN